MNNEQIEMAFKEVFPNSRGYARVGAIDGKGIYFKGYLSKDNSEVANGIIENDPLSYMFSVYDGVMKEEYASLSVKPSNPMFYCESAKIRKVSIKNVDYDKMVARFKKIKEFIAANKDNIINPQFDINDKI